MTKPQSRWNEHAKGCGCMGCKAMDTTILTPVGEVEGAEPAVQWYKVPTHVPHLYVVVGVGEKALGEDGDDDGG